MFPVLVIIALACAVACLYIKNRLLKRGLQDITRDLSELLSEDTNVLISLSSGDKALREFASALNRELREMKRLRRKYQNGDRELKDAVTNISHDLRTPLTAICGYLELLGREPKSETVERYIAHIENRTEAMKQLTEELFRYSVILSTSEEMTLEPIDIGAALEDSIAGLYGALTERGIVPEISIPDEKIIKNLNREALSRIYGNILGNALKYSDGDLKVAMYPSGAVEFSNTAGNLSGVDVGKLFDRFFSVEAARNSTGLGLAISKTLVEQMGGNISAEMNGDVLTIKIDWGEDLKRSSE